MMDDIEQKRPGDNGPTASEETSQPYDATQDPRTGRPPSPHQAWQLAQERHARAAEIDEEDFADGQEEIDNSLPESQAPARMTSPGGDEDEQAAIDALIQEGVTRERAEALVEEHGANWETLKAAAFAAHSTQEPQ